MKKNIVCIILLCAAFSLYAQSNSAAVFVPPVTGTGSKPEDNDYFYKQLISEIKYQKFNLAKAQKDAEFSLVAVLSVLPDNADGVKQYNLHLELKDNQTNKARSDGDLVYETPEDIKEMFPSLVYTLLYTIPTESGKDNWRNKRLYAGAAAFWTPRIYNFETMSTYIANFGGGIFAEYHILHFLSAEAGLELASDSTKIVQKAEPYNNVLLEIPVLLKFIITPGDYFVLEPYAGVHFNIPFQKTTVPPAISWLIGFQYGVKAGPGILFIDPRFSMDLGKSTLADPPTGASDISFQRYIIHIGIGYKLGFFTKR